MPWKGEHADNIADLKAQVQSARAELEEQKLSGGSAHADALKSSEVLMEAMKKEHANDMAKLAAELEASQADLKHKEEMTLNAAAEHERSTAAAIDCRRRARRDHCTNGGQAGRIPTSFTKRRGHFSPRREQRNRRVDENPKSGDLEQGI